MSGGTVERWNAHTGRRDCCSVVTVPPLHRSTVPPLMAAIKVPPLGESIVEATVSRWLKQEGDAVSPGDTLVELETDKITVEVPAMTGGVLKKRAHAEGDVVKVDDVLAEVEEGAVAAASPAKPAGQAAP